MRIPLRPAREIHAAASLPDPERALGYVARPQDLRAPDPLSRMFAPASPDRGPGRVQTRATEAGDRGEVSATGRQRALTWAQRLRRVFAIEIETCRRCGGRLCVIASIEAPSVIAWIRERLSRDTESVDPAHPSRAPPQRDLSL